MASNIRKNESLTKIPLTKIKVGVTVHVFEICVLCCVVETEDDHVAEAVQRARRIKLDIELVLALTDETFTSIIKERNIVFTLFYLPCK